MGLFRGSAKNSGGKGGFLRFLVGSLFNLKTIWHTLFVIFLVLSIAPELGTAFQTGDFRPVGDAFVKNVVLADANLYQETTEFLETDRSEMNKMQQIWFAIKGGFKILAPLYIILYFIGWITAIMIWILGTSTGSSKGMAFAGSMGFFILAVVFLYLLQSSYYANHDIDAKPFSGIVALKDYLLNGEITDVYKDTFGALPTKGDMIGKLINHTDATIKNTTNTTLTPTLNDTNTTLNTSVGAWG